jgi:hypothetical protein
MRTPREQLRAAGIELAAGGDREALLLECARLARRMRERLVRAIGLAPAGDDVAVPAIAIELGHALAVTSPGPVGVVDANGSWPCARGLVEIAASDGRPLVTSWLLDNLAVLTPRVPSAALEQLRSALAEQATGFEDLVVDLTGFDHLGEELAAFWLFDAVVLVARCGRTTTRQIERWMRAIPDERGLGVLLTGL